jgi:hypothetical protein
MPTRYDIRILNFAKYFHLYASYTNHGDYITCLMALQLALLL